MIKSVFSWTSIPHPIPPKHTKSNHPPFRPNKSTIPHPRLRLEKEEQKRQEIIRKEEERVRKEEEAKKKKEDEAERKRQKEEEAQAEKLRKEEEKKAKIEADKQKEKDKKRELLKKFRNQKASGASRAEMLGIAKKEGGLDGLIDR